MLGGTRMMIILDAALVLAAQGADPFEKARADISTYCRRTGEGNRCVQKQKKELGHFVMMMTAFRLSKTELQVCILKGKRGRYVDWAVATQCVRKKVKWRPLGT